MNLNIFGDFSSGVPKIISILPMISRSLSLFSKLFRTIPRVLTAIRITVIFYSYSYFSFF